MIIDNVLDIETNKIVIISTPRSGSTALYLHIKQLKQIDDKYCWFEPWNYMVHVKKSDFCSTDLASKLDDRSSSNWEEGDQTFLSKSSQRGGGLDPSYNALFEDLYHNIMSNDPTLIKSLIHSHCVLTNKSTSFKENLIKELLTKQCSFILLDRKDKFQQILSLSLSLKTDVWHGNTSLIKKSEFPLIYIEPSIFNKAISYIHQHTTLLLQFKEYHSQFPLYYYEDIHFPAHLPISKNLNNELVIANYDELLTLYDKHVNLHG